MAAKSNIESRRFDTKLTEIKICIIIAINILKLLACMTPFKTNRFGVVFKEPKNRIVNAIKVSYLTCKN